ncbi:response regulator [Aquabacterium sp.]|uniref:response regulator n=1 Tax=Aquabacterium sp. TaxID=1872578 RepID=UPI0035AE5E64
MKRILLVDDEPSVLSALKRVLRMRFATEAVIETFNDPRLALQRLADTSFDVLLSDYRMPQMTGIDFLRQARALQPHAVRMILSASSDFQIIQRAVNEVEVFRYLAKPWAEDELAEQMRAALDRSSHARDERQLADAMRVQRGTLNPIENEKRRLEEQEPGITHVEWGPNGEILMPDGLLDPDTPPPRS